MEKQTRIFPSIWRTFERTKDGKVIKFWVQDLTDEHMETAIEIFGKYFVRDEPCCRSLKLSEDSKALELAKGFWRLVAAKKCSLACFTKLENGQDKMVALNFCYGTSADEQKKEDLGDLGIAGLIVEAMNFLYDLKDPVKEIGVKEYLAALGLVTIPEYRGLNIGLEVLRSRQPLCAALGLKASITVFTSEASQRLAEKAGFKDLVAMSYDELEKMNSTCKFPNITQYSRYVRNMYILYE